MASISETDAAAAGASSRAALLARLAAGAGADANGGGGNGGSEVWRVDFRCLGADDRIALRQQVAAPAAEVAELRRRLDRLDRAADGPWTARLGLNAAASEGRPGVRGVWQIAGMGLADRWTTSGRMPV